MIDILDAARMDVSSRLVVTPYGVDLILSRTRIILPMSVESKECIGCVTAS
jgi:hypothetical protein